MNSTQSLQKIYDYFRAINLSIAIAAGLIAYIYAVSIGGVSSANLDLFVSPLLAATISFIPAYLLSIKGLGFRSSKAAVIELHFAVALLGFWIIFMSAGIWAAMITSLILPWYASWNSVQLLLKSESDVLSGAGNPE